ncbi:GIY-YIG nuclease family protein [Candidatus Saccharibacteria bacterium]|nr:GIY-YIG nuclease family protein [Candidatus Saccharibacteria bacterium]
MTYYVYIIKSINSNNQIYTGFTKDLQKRFAEHNAGKSKHTSKFRPWELSSYFAFQSEVKAREFEKYLKSGSWIAFRNRHFL